MIKIVFDDLKINEIRNSSGVFSGHNYQSNWKDTNKTVEGFGRIFGDKNNLKNGRSIVRRNP